MTVMMRYSPDQVALLAASIGQQLAHQQMTESAVGRLLGEFKFRDQQGATWTIGPHSQTWYKHGKSRWSKSAKPPGDTLDGSAEMDILSTLPLKQMPSLTESADNGNETPSVDPIAYMTSAVERIAQAYANGALLSEAAESMLASIYAVDTNGTVWALGVRSRKWYTFTEDGWRHSEQALDRGAFGAPEASSDSRHCANCGRALEPEHKFCPNCGSPVPTSGKDEPPEEVVEKVKRFLASDVDLFPEPVVPPWAPPQDFPETVTQCQYCGAFNVGEIRNCVSCERPLQARSRTSGVSTPAAISTPAPAAATVSALTPAAAHAPAAQPGQSIRDLQPNAEPSSVPRSRRRWLWWLVGAAACLALTCACGVGMLALGQYIYDL